MADATAMNVLDAADDLLKELAGFGFLELLALHDVVEKLAPAGVLHDEKELARSLNYLYPPTEWSFISVTSD